MVATRVSAAGVAGSQCSAQAPEVLMSQTWGSARAAGTAGRWKLLDIGPVRVARERATAKTISSLAIGIVLNFFPERGSGVLSLKDYPRARVKLNLEQDRDISGIPQHSRGT